MTCRVSTQQDAGGLRMIFLDDARPPPTDPLAALGLSDRLARPGNVKERMIISISELQFSIENCRAYSRISVVAIVVPLLTWQPRVHHTNLNEHAKKAFSARVEFRDMKE
eukprot:1191972-Prorocentrum_minimum.AAC.3